MEMCRLGCQNMLNHKICYLLKRGLVLCLAIAIFLFVLPSAYISKGAGNSFGVSLTGYSEMDVSRFSDRLSLVRSGCEAENARVDYAKTLLYSRKLNLLYCPVPFTSSTQLKNALLKTEGKTLKLKKLYKISTLQAIHSEAQALNVKHSVLLHPEKLKGGSQQTLIIVRDPWQRLATAYRELALARSAYKTQCSKFTDILSRELTFHGFLQCLLFYANGTHSLVRLDTKLSPIHTLCSTCKVPYSFIAKYETIDEDLHDLVRTKKSEVYTKFFTFYKEPAFNNTYSVEESMNPSAQSLSRKVIDDIQNLYEMDFKMFGYPFV